MSILSPKSLFYLKHQADIDAWAKLPSTVAEDVDRWLSTWGDLMEEHLPGVPVYQDTGSSYSKLLWYRDEWWSGDGSAAPDLGIGLEWIRSRAHQESALYHGVWVNLSDGKREALKARLDELVGATERFKQGGRTADRFSFWEYLDPVGPVLAKHATEALDHEDSAALRAAAQAYQARLIDQARGIWDEFSALVDRAIEEVRS